MREQRRSLWENHELPAVSGLHENCTSPCCKGAISCDFRLQDGKSSAPTMHYRTCYPNQMIPFHWSMSSINVEPLSYQNVEPSQYIHHNPESAWTIFRTGNNAIVSVVIIRCLATDRTLRSWNWHFQLARVDCKSSTKLAPYKLMCQAFVPANVDHRYPLSRLWNESKECRLNEKVPRLPLSCSGMNELNASFNLAK